MGTALLIWLSTAGALAQSTASDKAVTSVGAQGVRAEAIQETTAGLIVGERLRWEFAPSWRVLADARLNIYPDEVDTPLDQSRVRTLGVTLDDAGLFLAVGRHPVEYGGPRLVDGVQALARTGPWELGAWGGMAPDLFTTAPAVRPGGGPIVAFHQGWMSWSVVGEVVGAEGGLDRAGVLALARASFNPILNVSGRLDAQLADGDGNSGLADGAVFARLTPGDTLRFDAFYDAFSSLRYQRTESLDPAVRRFAERVDQLGIADPLSEDLVDPSLHHLVGGSTRWQSPTDVALRLGARARYRHHEDPLNRYSRLGPSVGVVGLVDDRLELIADGYANTRPDIAMSWDAGLTTFLELGRERALALDSSGRVLIDPAYAGKLGGYADLFVDWLIPGDVALAAGVNWTLEPDPDLDDVGIGAFVRAQQTFRPGRKRPVPVPTVSDVDVPPLDEASPGAGGSAPPPR